METWEVALWIALPSLIALAVLAVVYAGVRWRQRFPPVKK